MEAHDLEKELRYWGRVYGPAPETEWEEDSSHGSGLLTGCLIDFIRVGIVTGTEKERIVIDRTRPGLPEQVVVGTLTARGKESQGGAKPMKAHPVADRIDRLCCQMYRERVVPALVLRADYCMRGPRREKMPWINAIVGRRISRRRYSTELDWAKAWMLYARNKIAA